MEAARNPLNHATCVRRSQNGAGKRLVYNWRFIDLVCRPRAAHVVRQTRILRYLYPPVTLLPVRHSVFICQRW
jgi:hypothetical protein